MSDTKTNNGPSLKDREVGAIWQNEKSMMMRLKNSAGQEVKFLILKNNWKEEGSKQPDFRVYKDLDQSPAPAKKAPAPPKKKVVAAPESTSGSPDFV